MSPSVPSFCYWGNAGQAELVAVAPLVCFPKMLQSSFFSQDCPNSMIVFLLLSTKNLQTSQFSSQEAIPTSQKSLNCFWGRLFKRRQMGFSLTTCYSHLPISNCPRLLSRKSYMVGIFHKLTFLFHHFSNCLLSHFHTGNKTEASFLCAAFNISKRSQKVLLSL